MLTGRPAQVGERLAGEYRVRRHQRGVGEAEAGGVELGVDLRLGRVHRLVELDELLMHEGATSNMDSYRKMTREHAEIDEIGQTVGLCALPASPYQAGAALDTQYFCPGTGNR